MAIIQVFLRSMGLAVILAVFSFGTGGQAQNTPEIGVAAAVNPNAQGTPPAAETRTLEVGVNIQANERIVTSADGQAQMLFLDESAFTVGPNSDLVLDEFVYDPATGTGKIALSATKGVFRMVGGKISKRTPVTLKTPTATIGIRGGIALVNVADNGATQATFLFGDQMTVDTAGGSQQVNRPGFTVSATASDAPPSNPAPATGDTLNAALGSLEGTAPPPADDGSPAQPAGGQRPTDQRVASSNLGALGSGNSPRALEPAAPPAGPPAAQGDGGQTAENTTAQAQQNTNLNQNLGISITGLTGRYRSRQQYLSNTFNSSTSTISPDTSRNIGFTGASSSGATFTANLGTSTLSLPIKSGTFSLSNAGTTPFGSVDGTGVLSSDQRFLFYELTEGSSNNRAFTFAGIPLASGSSSTSGFTVLAYSLRNDFLNSTSTDIPFIFSDGSAVSRSSANVSPFYIARRPSTSSASATLQTTLAIVGQGSSQQSLLVGHTGTFILNSQNQTSITGGMRGMSRTSATSALVRSSGGIGSVPDSSGASLFTNASGAVSYFVLNNDFYGTGENTLTTALSAQKPFDSTAATFYSYDHVATPTTAPSGIGNTRTARTLNGYAAGLVERNTTTALPSFIIENDDSNTGSPGDPTAVKIITDPSINRVSGEFGVQIEDDSRNYELRFGTTSGTSGRGTFIDDNNFAARESSASTSTINSTAVSALRFFMVNQEVVPTTGFLPSGVSFCTCQFLEWGYWVAEGVDASSNVDRFHLATWVAGKLPALVDIPMTGTATYSGHLNGSVDNNGSRYQAVGTFQNAWNFSTHSGAVTVTNFDGSNFSNVSVSANSTNRRDFAGSGSNGTKSISFHGSFFQGGSDAVAEQGGQFHVIGTNYKAAGTFAAKSGGITTSPAAQ
ncbi:MAG: FecR domain-containing protein [Alphaproteobacteria bacterium]